MRPLNNNAPDLANPRHSDRIPVMKNVIITGAGRGIGLALTKEFTNHNYNVFATYRDAKSAKELLDFAKTHPTITPVTLDVTDQKTFKPLKDQLKKSGSIDILINNSGVIGDEGRSLLELDMETVEEVLKVNTIGPMRVTQAVIPFMNKSGTIAQISSLMGSIKDNGSGGYYDYRTSKTALNMFNMCLSKEFPQFTCLTLHPGWVQTDMGGPNATVSIKDSAQGLFKVITTTKQTGQFIDYTGKELPW